MKDFSFLWCACLPISGDPGFSPKPPAHCVLFLGKTHTKFQCHYKTVTVPLSTEVSLNSLLGEIKPYDRQGGTLARDPL